MALGAAATPLGPGIGLDSPLGFGPQFNLAHPLGVGNEWRPICQIRRRSRCRGFLGPDGSIPQLMALLRKGFLVLKVEETPQSKD